MNPAPRLPPWVAPALVGLVAFLAFLPALPAEWTNWDDDLNFLNNPHYRGLGGENLAWMWTTFHMGHYHPLTWMTLGLDYTLWGMDARGYHVTNVLLHAAGAVVLYFVIALLLRLSGRGDNPWPAVAGALVHAIHPLRVESVAWITERRDVLCGLFALMTVYFYLRHAEDGRRKWLAWSVAAFAAALLSKALAIMLPAVLLILDITPLRRFAPGSRRRVLLEKLPFALVSCADLVVMLFAMRHISAVRSIETYNLLERIAQASYGLCFYLAKTVWPSGLIPIHRIETPMNPGEPKYVLAMIAVAGATALLVAFRRRRPDLLAAWLCYVVLVLPVLGVAVTGRQIAADRYTYLSLIPLAVLAAAAANRASGLPPLPRHAVFAGAALLLIGLVSVTIRQTGHWRDSIALWSHQIDVDPGWHVPWLSRAQARHERGDAKGAAEDLARSLELDPNYDKALNLRGLLRLRARDAAGARADFDRAIEVTPGYVTALVNRGDLRREQGDLDGALSDAEAAIRRDPDWGRAYVLRGMIHRARGDLAGALADLDRGVRLAPGSPEAFNNRATLHLQSGRPSEAVRDYDASLALRPDNPPVLVGRGQARMLLGDRPGAAADFERALRLASPAWPLRAEVEAMLKRVR